MSFVIINFMVIRGIKLQLTKFLLSLALSFSAAIIGSFFTSSAIPTWYVQLNKPVFSPPNWVFGPVWTVLYFLIGVAFYLIWVSENKRKSNSLRIFVIQLILNTLWSFIFFGLRNPLLALIEIIVLWISIFLTIKSFNKISKNAAMLLLPYLFWVSFATVLNLYIVLLNP